MYKLLRSILFCFDPEKVHYFSMNSLKFICKIPLAKKTIAKSFTPTVNTQHSLFNIAFKNSVGLGAGFDKNARYLNELEALGFGFVEIGTVTPKPQAGNDKPRLFRLPADKALINRMGFNNDGADVIVERLQKWTTNVKRQSPVLTPHTSRLIIGGNIGKNKVTPNEDAWKDYEICFNKLHDYVDYFVVNVSSPNTPGLRELQEKDSLKKILVNLQIQNLKFETQKPILLKIAPDLSWEQIDDVIDLAIEIKLDGLVAANTTIDRSKLSQQSKIESEKIGAGGLSGLPVKERATEMVQYISKKTNRQIPIIASGGIFTAADAKEKLDAGASLVQVWTGFIYEGPAIVKNIVKEL
ncbi:quinone-dependent dihydroorotate dehydrogenase [Ferruginibacter albus]|uniref:quinone-dependent dihydroorotate dehydrogenase n=1 Tax=Ferruginibacter albus TaxID=2875540 RepID=UPI001CC7399B|nr:quinone-dependent dihydroorotate dehydrogenase [Ferruginibacter albus]UAY52518.1 quinone-dependent dihydroorotate dehydrogenase [Ferruginibacter albus]